MKLKTKLYLTKCLFVKVPNTVDNDELEADLGMCLEYNQYPSLKNGITVEQDNLQGSFEHGDDWHKGVIPFIKAVLEIKPQPDEFFFHL